MKFHSATQVMTSQRLKDKGANDMTFKEIKPLIEHEELRIFEVFSNCCILRANNITTNDLDILYDDYSVISIVGLAQCKQDIYLKSKEKHK